MDVTETRAADATRAGLEVLAETPVFFGHQSVGANLIAGLEEIVREHPDVPVRIQRVSSAADVGGPGLYHAVVGENGRPATKTSEFVRIAGAVEGRALVFLKYCYVDVTVDTDPAALFAAYRDAVSALQAGRPDLTVLHVTLPLWEDRGLAYHLRTVLRGKPSHRARNLVRERYNARLREAYAGREPLFDLARFESTGPDGSRTTVRFRGVRVPVLDAAWTDDGGHLNAAGRRRMAEALLAALAGR